MSKDLLYEAEVKKGDPRQIQIIALLKEEIEKTEKAKLLVARHNPELANTTRDKVSQDKSKGYVLGRAVVARKRPVDLDDDFDDHVRTADPQTRMRLID